LHNTQDRDDEGAIISVPRLLNIFYRGRAAILGLTALGLLAGIGYGIVVKPLYRATAQVRPGVVSYTPEGMPLREWALEDIVRWFGGALYWEDFKTVPGFQEMKSAPIIDASFVPSLNFVAGGNVITLTNLAQQPELAVATLSQAIGAFNRQAMADSMGSSLHLTLRQGRSMMRKLRHDIDLVDARADRVKLDIAAQGRELTMVELHKQELELDLQAREADNVWIKAAVESSHDAVASTRERLDEAEKVLAVALESEQSGSSPVGAGSDAVGTVLRQTASREMAGRVGDLLMTVQELTTFINEQTVHADSLAARVRTNELEIGRIRLQQDVEVAKQRADIEQKITDLEITLAKDLPHDRDVLQNTLETERIKVEVVSPLERVGNISVSDKPVRPRKLRAAAILTILGFFGSLFLVLVWDYLRNNWAAISAADDPNS